MSSLRNASGSRKILVIDPNRELANELEKTLIGFGYEAVATTHWRRAIRLAEEHRPDLICIEVGIRGHSGGIEIAQEIWSKLGIPALFIANPEEVPAIESAKGIHLLGYLAKPFDESRLHCSLELAFANMEEHRRAEAKNEKLSSELQTVQNQLIQAQKMEVVGGLTAGIAHDFNNILLPILGYSSLLSESLQDQPKLKELADQIHQAGQSASALTRQLLAFSRHQEEEKEVLDIQQIVKNSKIMIDRLLGEEYSLEMNLEKEALYTLIDRGQIEQVLMNLCLNSKDAMDVGGRITISTRKLQPTDAEVKEISEKVEGEWMCLTVRDTGYGMTEETMEHMFEAYYSTKDGEGTGLGLSVVHGIVTQHDGHIQVTSELGEGSEFRIYLPLEKQVEFQNTEPAVEPVPSRTGSEKILLIEDEPRVRTFVTKALANRGYQVSTAEDLSTAEQLLRQSRREDGRSSFNLIFSDCVLPDGNGAEFLERELPDYPGVRALLTTGYAEGERISEAVADMNIAFLQKPYPLAKLLNVIRDILDEEIAEAC